MNKRQVRLAQIVEILTHNSVSSQEDLLLRLAERGYHVTQATLSRDLKTLRTSKVPTEMGGYRYIVAGAKPQDEDAPAISVDAARQSAVISVQRTGNIVVIKTRNGYAGGLAYDIDTMDDSAVVGTIAGADTVFVAIDENATPADVYMALSRVIPKSVIDTCCRGFV